MIGESLFLSMNIGIKNNGMNKDIKGKTIDLMIFLLNLARNLPMFSIYFYIEAENNNIESYLGNHTIKYDWNGKHLGEEEIQDNIRHKLEEFYESEGYNTEGQSKLRMMKTFTVQDITFDKIYSLVSGQEEDMPIGYKYIGDTVAIY